MAYDMQTAFVSCLNQPPAQQQLHCTTLSHQASKRSTCQTLPNTPAQLTLGFETAVCSSQGKASCQNEGAEGALSSVINTDLSVCSLCHWGWVSSGRR